jgi:choline dehydrogenase
VEKVFDYIVVGAGSAGCTLAYRLAEDGKHSVLLLEAGSRAWTPMIHIPLGFAFLLKEHRNNWSYRTAAEPHLNGRNVDLPRGKVLGGCSAINGMVYVRGQAADYDRWAEMGNAGWSYADVLPYFKRSEDFENGANAYPGSGGPMRVSLIGSESPLCDAFIEGEQQAGHAFNPDINGISQEGVGYFPATIRNGRRQTSAGAFLKPGRALKNLTVLTRAETTRVLADGDRATGVDCRLRGKSVRFSAARETILCSGAINSPKILELSGIGQADRLRRLNIPLVRDLPGVGENLHDHWNAYIVRNVDRGANYYSESKPLPMLRNLLRFLFFGKSFLAQPAAHVAVFYKALAQAQRPDAQIHFSPAASVTNDSGNLAPIDGATVASCGLRPTSRGTTHIRDHKVETPPDICVNYLSTEQDRTIAIEAFRKARDILTADALGAYGGTEIRPGAEVTSDAQVLDYIRNEGDPVHHLAGSCKMGSDELSVVDSRLSVHGVENLRVADASIMPEIVSGNTHAACVMIAEKAADMILGRTPDPA